MLNIENLSLEKPIYDHKDKLIILKYFSGDKCYCGNTKKENRWDCLQCCGNRDKNLAKTLEKHCSEHIRSALKMIINSAKETNESNTSRRCVLS